MSTGWTYLQSSPCMDTNHIALIEVLLHHKTLYNTCNERYADQDKSVGEKLAYCYIVSKNLKKGKENRGRNCKI